MSEDNTIYWAVIRDKTQRVEYIELEDLGRGKWGVVLGLNEFTFTPIPTTDFFDLLGQAIAYSKTL